MRKILFAIGNRAHYARIKPIIERLNNKCIYKLLIYDTAYKSLRKILEDDNYISKCIFIDTYIKGGNLLTMTKSTGNAILLMSDTIAKYMPDIMVVIADRYEIMAPAIIARYMNICLVHIQGGEITGTIDDSIRHTVSKLSNYHFISNVTAKRNLLRMGENEDDIFVTGCPTLDVISNNEKLIDNKIKKFWKKEKTNDIPDYILVNFHPITTEYNQNSNYVKVLYEAIKEFNCQIIWLMPNSDAGSDKIRKETNNIKQTNEKILFFENFEVIEYLSLLKYAKCVVGNSSVGIRETSYLGTPSITIGSRQKNRETANNVIRCDINSTEIKDAIIYQMGHGKYKTSTLYGDGHASERIANNLLNVKIKKEKFVEGGYNDK